MRHSNDNDLSLELRVNQSLVCSQIAATNIHRGQRTHASFAWQQTLLAYQQLQVYREHKIGEDIDFAKLRPNDTQDM